MDKCSCIVLIIWIGDLPKSFPMWLSSSENQPFDFIFFTDQPKPKNCNHKWHYATLESLKIKFSASLNFDIELSFPYKICDYRPAFGEIFHEYIKQYDYWGYCDLDIIFGDCNLLIKKIQIESPDKILQRGHLSFFKNTPDINSIYKEGISIDYKYIFSTNKSCMFDEWHGIGKILKEKNKKIFHEEMLADINPNSYLFTSTNLRNYNNQIFVYENRKIFQYSIQDNSIIKKELCYLHFQKRSIDFSKFNNHEGSYIFTSNKLIPLLHKDVSFHTIRSYNRVDLKHFFKRFLGRLMIKLKLNKNIFDQYVMRQV